MNLHLNREIKFRAWDKNKKVMIFDDSQEIQGIYSNALPGDYIPGCVRRIGECYQTYMQFTEYQDTNTKDIYQNDMVTFGADHNNYLVEFHSGSWRLSQRYRNTEEFHRIYLTVYYKEARVIGNIFENPELGNFIDE